MEVFLPVLVQIVIAMMRRPPEHAFLRAGLREARHPELPEPVHAERSMTEVAVVAARYRKHPEEVRPGQPGDQRGRNGTVNTSSTDA